MDGMDLRRLPQNIEQLTVVTCDSLGYFAGWTGTRNDKNVSATTIGVTGPSGTAARFAAPKPLRQDGSSEKAGI
jgi:hypothetical protein